ILTGQLSAWLQSARPDSWSARYVEYVALPGVIYYARLVPLGEIVCGLSLIVGFLTPLFAFIAFVMAFNFLFASGALFRLSILTTGYGLPVLGSTLGLAFGGARLPWSFRS